MVPAHFATALVAHGKFPEKTSYLILFLVACQIQDFMWFTLHYFGLETTLPESLLDMTVSGLDVDMRFSHDIVPNIVWAALMFVIGYLVSRNWKIALTASFLTVLHVIMDLTIGYPHHINGPGTAGVGTSSFVTHPSLSFFIDMVVSVAMVYVFLNMEKKNGISRTKRNKRSLYLLFAMPAIIFGMMGSKSVMTWLGLPPIGESSINTTVLGLIVSYSFIFWAIVRLVKQRETVPPPA